MKGNYKDLKVWEKAHDQILSIYKITSDFPVSEQFGLTSQLRRAAVSVELNIVEGKHRNSTKEFIRFLYVARGSNMEVHALINLSKDLQYIQNEEYQHLTSLCEEVNKMINGLINSIL